MEKENLEPHMIRACIDLRIPNKYMERNRIQQAPVLKILRANLMPVSFFQKWT